LKLKNFISIQSFLTIGIIFLLTFLFSFTPITKIKILKIIQKVLIGFGSSFLFWGIFYQSIPIREKYHLFTLTFGFIITSLNLYHVYGFLSTCYSCEIPFGWNCCNGFERIRESFKKYNLNDFFLYFKDFSDNIISKKELKQKIKSK
jgi:hypothetical protein